MMRFLLLLSIPLFLSCSSSSIHIRPQDLASPQLLSRGWSYVESSQESSEVPTGEPMVYYGQVEIMDNLLVYTSERFGISVLNKYNGAFLWRKDIKEGSRSGIAIQGNSIYVGGNDGFFRAYHKKGKELWKTDLRYPVRGKPLILGKRIFVSTIDHSIHALSLETGKVLWTYPHLVDSGMYIRGGGNISYAHKRLWVGFDDGVLLALRPKDGTPTFRRRFPQRKEAKFFDLDARVLSWKKGLLVSNFSGKLSYLKKNGALLWSFPAGSAHAPALRNSGKATIYLASNDGSVYAISEKGKKLWKYDLPGGVPTSLVYFQKKNIVLAASSHSYVYALDGDKGTLLDAAFLGANSGSYGAIAIDRKEQSFYLVSNYGRLYQFFVRSPASKQKILTKSP